MEKCEEHDLFELLQLIPPRNAEESSRAGYYFLQHSELELAEKMFDKALEDNTQLRESQNWFKEVASYEEVTKKNRELLMKYAMKCVHNTPQQEHSDTKCCEAISCKGTRCPCGRLHWNLVKEVNEES